MRLSSSAPRPSGPTRIDRGSDTKLGEDQLGHRYILRTRDLQVPWRAVHHDHPMTRHFYDGRIVGGTLEVGGPFKLDAAPVEIKEPEAEGKAE